MADKPINFQEVVKIDDIQGAACEISDSMDYIRDYGYVGFFDCTREEAEKMNEELVSHTLQAKEIASKISNHIRESFEY